MKSSNIKIKYHNTATRYIKCINGRIVTTERVVTTGDVIPV